MTTSHRCNPPEPDLAESAQVLCCRVVVVSGDPVERRALCGEISADGRNDVVGATGCWAEAIVPIVAFEPDVVVLADGPTTGPVSEVVTWLHRLAPKAAIAVLTERHPGLDDLAEVLSCGGAICLDRNPDGASGNGAGDLAGLVARLAHDR